MSSLISSKCGLAKTALTATAPSSLLTYIHQQINHQNTRMPATSPFMIVALLACVLSSATACVRPNIRGTASNGGGFQNLQQRHRQGCSIFEKYGNELSCQPGVQKCYHNPRREGELCAIGHACGNGLSCVAFVQVGRGHW